MLVSWSIEVMSKLLEHSAQQITSCSSFLDNLGLITQSCPQNLFQFQTVTAPVKIFILRV